MLPIRIDRFSPYFESHGAYGWSGLRPAPIYRELHPQLPEEELAELAYHFEGVGGTVSPEQYFHPLMAAVDRSFPPRGKGSTLF